MTRRKTEQLQCTGTNRFEQTPSCTLVSRRGAFPQEYCMYFKRKQRSMGTSGQGVCSKTSVRACRTLLSLIFVIGLTAGMGEAAMASEPTMEEVYEAALEAQKMAQRALDEQAVENIMSRHVLYHCCGEHREEMEKSGSGSPRTRPQRSSDAARAARWAMTISGNPMWWSTTPPGS